MNIYLDMDDVVADWKGYAKKFLRMEWKDGELVPDPQWKRLKDNQRMYRDLWVREGGHELVNWCRKYRDTNNAGLFFLTAIPHGNDMPWAPTDKVMWGQKYFPDIPVFIGPYSQDKWVRCQPGDILIDDRRSNNEEWINAGGRAHLYRNWLDCKQWLESELGEL
jgi:hypothetical protein